MCLEDFKNILKQFGLTNELIECNIYGEGHINVTYLAKFKDGKKFILQKINNKVFPNVKELMNNIYLVTNYCKNNIIKNNGNPDRETLTIIKTIDGNNFYEYQGDFYRLYIFIDDSITYQVVKNPLDFYNCALGFGEFYKLLEGFDASKLYEVIPNFHNTNKRYNDFLNAVKLDKFNRVKGVQNEIEFINKRKDYYSKIVDMLDKKELPLKVTHNDTKLNNILFDNKTNKPLSVIDLDTVMPGTICYDFGDSIRFGCNPASEDEKDLSKVNFRFDLYELYLKGFLKALGNNITEKEKEMLAFSSILMTIECGMRFLTDYLEGDHYFHTVREGQNLDRCRTQLKLVSDMEKIIDKMNALIK